MASIMHDKRNTTELDKLIGRRIRLFRQIKEIDLPDFAEKLGVSYQQVQKYENGSNRVSSSRLYIIAQIIAVKTDDFFPDFPIKKPSIDDISKLEPNTRKLFIRLLKLDKDQQSVISKSVLSVMKTNEEPFLELIHSLTPLTPALQRDTIQDMIAIINEKNV